jgi:hypothetical protein
VTIVPKASAMLRTLEFHPFRGRGFSDDTIQALITHGLELPEELLFMDEEHVTEIPGIGEAALAEIVAYWSKFPWK